MQTELYLSVTYLQSANQLMQLNIKFNLREIIFISNL